MPHHHHLPKKHDHHLQGPHLPFLQLHRSPRVRLCSCLVSVAKAKERRQIMELPFLHHLWLPMPIAPLLFGSRQCFRAPRGRGPPERVIDSTANSSHHGATGGLYLEELPSTREHQHECPTRGGRINFMERCENRPTWPAIHESGALSGEGSQHGAGPASRTLSLPRLTGRRGWRAGCRCFVASQCGGVSCMQARECPVCRAVLVV